MEDLKIKLQKQEEEKVVKELIEILKKAVGFEDRGVFIGASDYSPQSLALAHVNFLVLQRENKRKDLGSRE